MSIGNDNLVQIYLVGPEPCREVLRFLVENFGRKWINYPIYMALTAGLEDLPLMLARYPLDYSDEDLEGVLPWGNRTMAHDIAIARLEGRTTL